MHFTSPQTSTDYRVVFQHTTETSKITAPTQVRVIRASLQMKLTNGTYAQVFSGEAITNPLDNHNKEIGRRKSFGLAIKTFPRDFRKIAWGAYWESKLHTSGTL